jgi:acyl-CoA thioester hydrolase
MIRFAEFQPPGHAFTYRFVVRHEHIDELGHAGNVTWVQWVNDAAITHSRSVGLNAEVYGSLRLIWVVRKHEIDYVGQALEGDELAASTWIAQLRGATSLRRTVFMRASDDKPMVYAATTWALIDPTTGKPRRIPEELMVRYGFNSSR